MIFIPDSSVLQPKKVTKKGRPISFALRVPEFGGIAYAPVLMRHPGAQDYNAELANIALPMPPNSANEKGMQVKRKNTAVQLARRF